ncbi:hypothetical protein ACQKMD_01090 [Viridibacillus sp. NPDC096237]
MGYLDIASILTALLGLAKFRKIWHDGTKTKQEAKKVQLENRRTRRGG